MKATFKYLFLILFILTNITIVKAQGIYTEFGENRVVNEEIVWKSMKVNKDEIIYELGQEKMVANVLQLFIKEKKALERELQYQIRGEVRVIIFTSFTSYSQANFGISNQQFYAGGYIYTPHNSIFVYFNGDYEGLIKDIKKGLSRSLINEMVLGNTMFERVQSSALLTLPEWFVNGLASYYSEKWSTEYDNLMRDAIENKTFKNFTSLDKDMQEFAGHSIWYFIENKYGKEKLRNIIFYSRLTRNVESGISNYTGLSISKFLAEWQNFFKEKYSTEKELFNQPRGEENKLRKYSKVTNTSMSLSPNGKRIAFVTNNRGAYKVMIYNLSTRQTITLFKGGSKTYTREPNYFFPLVKWISKNKVAVLQEENGELQIGEYSLNGKKSFVLKLDDYDWVRDFSYNADGDKLVFSAVNNGMTSLVVYNKNNDSYNKISDDLFDISEVAFMQNNNILFISNFAESKIPSEDLIKNDKSGVFYFDITTKTFSRITPIDSRVKYLHPVDMGDSLISFISNYDGINNSYLVKYEGNQTDFSDFTKLTNYNRSILSQSVSIADERIAELIFTGKEYKIYVSTYNSEDLLNKNYGINISQTAFRKDYNLNNINEYEIEEDSEVKLPIDLDLQEELPETENNKNKQPAKFQTPFPNIDYITAFKKKSNITSSFAFLDKAVPFVKVDYFLLRFLDNSIIGDYYFQGGLDESIFYSTLFSPRMSFAISDMFNNNVLKAEVRYMGLLNGSDYLLEYKNQKGRLNKTIFFNRRARYFDSENYYRRNTMTLGGFGLDYPLSDKSRIDASVQLRNDQHLDLSIDSQSLFNDDPKQYLLGTKLSFVYDNTISRDLNLLQGTRIKLFASPYFGLTQKGYNLMFGIDARNYSRLHRQLTWANRFTANTSMGSLKTAYFIGGVENWYKSNFESYVHQLRDKDFVLQTLGAPVRGFAQNVRSGTTYMVINSELRFPIIAYLTQKPIRFEWLKSIMLVGFIDAGTAWVGASPYGTGSPYNTLVFNNPDYDITVTANRNPFVLGTGFGARIKVDSYYLKYDAGWGFREDYPVNLIHYFSLGLDF